MFCICAHIQCTCRVITNILVALALVSRINDNFNGCFCYRFKVSLYLNGNSPICCLFVIFPPLLSLTNCDICTFFSPLLLLNVKYLCLHAISNTCISIWNYYKPNVYANSCMQKLHLNVFVRINNSAQEINSNETLF